MQKVENKKFVCLDYTGTLETGEVFDTSHGRQPLEIQMGAGQLIRGFENALLGMAVSQKKTFTLAPEEAYGHRDESLTQKFARADVPPEMNPRVGDTVGLSTADGQQVPAMISAVDDHYVTVDLNHPMAGKTLTFAIEILGISDAPTQHDGGCGEGCDCSSGSCH